MVTDKEQPFILVCAHTSRTKTIAEIMGLKLKYKNVYELDAWIDKGFTTLLKTN